MTGQLTRTAPDLRASHRDREETAERLGAAYAEDRLGSEELKARVERALAARTQGELAELVADLPRPASPTPAAEPRPVEPAWKSIMLCLCCWRH